MKLARLILQAIACLWSCWGFVGYAIARALKTSRTWHDGAFYCVASGRVADWFRARNWSAFALGWVVVLWGEPRSPYTKPHERRHVWQAYWLGPFYLPVYGALLLVCGYRRHPMERDARRASGEPPR